jgi:hypothetical protein
MFEYKPEGESQQLPHESYSSDLTFQIVLLAGMVEKINEYKDGNNGTLSKDVEEDITRLHRDFFDEEKMEALITFLGNVAEKEHNPLLGLSVEKYEIIKDAYVSLNNVYTELLKDDSALRDYKSVEKALMSIDVFELNKIIEKDIVGQN